MSNNSKEVTFADVMCISICEAIESSVDEIKQFFSDNRHEDGNYSNFLEEIDNFAKEMLKYKKFKIKFTYPLHKPAHYEAEVDGFYELVKCIGEIYNDIYENHR